MNLELDTYAHLDSLLHRWESRYKLVGLTILAFVISFVQDLRLLPATLAIALGFYVVSGLPFSFLMTRMRTPGFFLLLVTILLPFFSGSTVLLRVGPIALRQEGCLDLLSVVVKFVAILTIGLVLFGTAPFLTTIKAMRALGLPPVLSDMTLLSYRYLYEVGGDLERMETAMGLRGFRARRLTGRVLNVLASLAGSILVHSYEKSDRVYKAMVLRGYGRSSWSHEDSQVLPRDRIVFGAVLVLAAGLIAGELLFRAFG